MTSETLDPEAQVGKRLFALDKLGTVRYVGPVDGHPGIYYGVEWDDLNSGTHNGTVAGKTYFSTSSAGPKSASLIRPKLANFGSSILYAITRQSNGDLFKADKTNRCEFEVYYSGMKLIHNVIDLTNYHVNEIGDKEELKNIFASVYIESLYIPQCLIGDWSTITSFISDLLPYLRFLDVSFSRLKVSNGKKCVVNSLAELNIVGMGYDFEKDILPLFSVFQNLKFLRADKNKISNLSGDWYCSTMQFLSVVDNNIKDWNLTVDQLAKNAPNLVELSISENRDLCYKCSSSLPIRKLSINGCPLMLNLIDGELTWPRGLQNLESLCFDYSMDHLSPWKSCTWWDVFIAHFPNLRTINRSVIDERARTDGEIN
ncbi:hypothetical protein ACOME3_009396 [Neoechinorhynchus agilis]